MPTSSSNSTPKVAIIGAGGICRDAHIPALTNLAHPIVSLTDRSNKALKTSEKLVRTGALIKSDNATVCNSADCAIVCTPPTLHYTQVKQLLKQRLHVLCEKPLACGHSEAAELRDLAEELGLVLQAGYYRRFQPSSSVCKELIANQELGAPVRCDFVAGHMFSSPPPSFTNFQLSGGGALMDYGVHILDRILDWFGTFELTSYADDSNGGMEANCILSGEGKIDSSSIPISIKLSRTANIGYFVRIYFKKYILESPLNSGHSIKLIANQSSPKNTPSALTGTLEIAPEHRYIKYFEEQFKEFTNRISGQGEKKSSIDDAVRVQELVELCYKEKTPLTPACGW